MKINKNAREIIAAILIVSLLPLAIWRNWPAHLFEPAIAYEQIFAKLYENGSYAKSNAPQQYTTLIQEYLLDPTINRVVALGCAPPNIANMHLPGTKSYVGYDVVPEIIYNNNAEFSSDNVQFYYVANFEDLPRHNVSGDLLLVQDFLEYWPNKAIHYFIARILPRFKYAIISSRYIQDTSQVNADTELGAARPIDLLKRPFNLPRAKVVMEYNSIDAGHSRVLLYKSRRT